MNDTPEQKMSNLLKLIGNTATCGSSTRPGCGQPIVWVVTKAGKRMPLNGDGVPHWTVIELPRPKE